MADFKSNVCQPGLSLFACSLIHPRHIGRPFLKRPSQMAVHTFHSGPRFRTDIAIGIETACGRPQRRVDQARRGRQDERPAFRLVRLPEARVLQSIWRLYRNRVGC